MAEGERGGWLPPHGDDDDREQQGGTSSGDSLWSGSQPPQPDPAPREDYGGFQPPTQSGWSPPPAGAQPGGQWGPGPQQSASGVQDSNRKATASLICGIVGIVFCPIVFSVAAIILGYQARKEIDASAGRQQNRGIATAGIITGWVGLAFGAVLIVGFVILGMNSDTSEGDGGVVSESAIALLSALPL
jgi:hypothetical protein